MGLFSSLKKEKTEMDEFEALLKKAKEEIRTALEEMENEVEEELSKVFPQVEKEFIEAQMLVLDSVMLCEKLEQAGLFNELRIMDVIILVAYLKVSYYYICNQSPIANSVFYGYLNYFLK